jgi:hypothetical protein
MSSGDISRKPLFFFFALGGRTRVMARGKPWTEQEIKLLMEMAAEGLNPQLIYQSGKLPGRTLRAIGK